MDAYDEDPSAPRRSDAPPDADPVPQPPEPADTAEPAAPAAQDGPGPAETGTPAETTAPDGPTPAESTALTAPGPVAIVAQVESMAPGGPAGPSEPAPLGSGRPRTGVAALSLPYRIGASVALAVVAVAGCVHLGMVFLSVAPANTVTRQHGKAIEEWIYPEFEQNWKLFAPNPLQQNIDVEVRAQVRMADGRIETTGWNNLSARDGRDIDGSLLPSHTVQNELRRAWDVFLSTHDADNRPLGLRGDLSEDYLRRIMVLRLYRDDPTSREGTIRSVQIRSRTTSVPAPEWSGEKASATPEYRVLPWWTATPEEAAGGVK